MSTVTKGKILRYTLLPEFIPRLFSLFRSGFSHISYMIAAIFHMTGLLPPTHPYMNPNNIGHYGIRHVMAEAYGNLSFKKRNIDQIAIFFTVCLGLILLIVQMALILAMAISGDVMAQTSALELVPWTDWFTIGGGSGISSPATQDMAMMTLDRVFGVKGIFESCISTGDACVDYRGNEIIKSAAYPSPFHLALHKMLEFYSYGIVFVGAIVILYYVITITAETAQSGTPFGQRYSKAWVPVRFILFFALLTPLNINGVNAGLNGAQIVTLYTAKFGSNMASNAWGFFGTRLNHEYIEDKKSLIAQPHIPQLGSLTQFMFVAQTCSRAKFKQSGINIYPYIIQPFSVAYTDVENAEKNKAKKTIQLKPGDSTKMIDTSFSQELEKSNNGTIIIRFGEKDAKKHLTSTGNVSEECGEIRLQIPDVNEPGSIKIQEAYYTLIQRIWSDGVMGLAAQCLVNKRISEHQPNCTEWPSQTTLTHLNTEYKAEIGNMIKEGVEEQVKNADTEVTETLKQKGWVLAAVWFNKIAQMNGAVTTSVFNVPRPHAWPRVLEEVQKQKRKSDSSIPSDARFDAILSGGHKVKLTNDGDQELAIVLAKAFKGWEGGAAIDSIVAPSGNIFLDTITMIMGASGLFEMRNSEIDIHPLAQISGLGKGIIEAAMRNVLTAGALNAGRSIFGLLGGDFTKDVAQAASKFLFSITMTTILIGVILYYIVPFLPFIYFLFAVSGWIKSIFEAIVAMPLWALAHLRIDGEGIPGSAASNGYFLLLDIVIRPTLIVVGLIASISIFSAMVRVLHEIFDLVVANAGGYDTSEKLTAVDAEYYRSTLDQLMFTVIYAVLVYIMALSNFKLIDQIPNQILRWAGAGVKTFQEEAGDPAQNLTDKVYRGGTLMQGNLSGGTVGMLISGK